MNAALNNYDTLPTELRAIIEDDEIISIINEIGDDFDIPFTWRKSLVRATIQILSGTMSPVKFIPFIMDEYNMEKEEALSIALIINSKIFSAVKPQLASLHNIEDSKLAHRIKVPHKPKYEEISEAMISPFTPTEIENSMTAYPTVIQPAPYIPPVKEVEITKQTLEKVLESESKTAPDTLAPLSSSALVNKLNNMRADPYREKY